MQKASAAQDATERKFLSKDFETDMRKTRAECAKDAAMLITVKAAIHNKKAGCGARLYKGDKNVASLAQKHLAPACEQVTGHDVADLKAIFDWTSVCRLILCLALKRGPDFCFPDKEMLISEFHAWLNQLHAQNARPMLHVPIRKTMRIGVDIGAIPFIKPKSGDRILQVSIEGLIVDIPGKEKEEFLWSEVGHKCY